MTEEERQAQLAPMQTLTAFTPEEEVDSDFSVSLCDIFPESYDSREQNLITSVKNQNLLASAGLSVCSPQRKPPR